MKYRTIQNCIMGVLLLAAGGVGASGGAAEKPDVPTPVETIPLESLDRLISHHPGAAFPSDWVATPAAPVVIRQNHPDGPSYQEAMGYTFLINSMKRPRLARMDSGRLVLVATAWLHRTGEENPIVIHSDDEGQSWSQPRQIPIFGSLVNLGGKKLVVFDTQMIFSEDSGKTWSKPKPLRLPGDKPAYHHGSVLVEGRTVWAVSYTTGNGANWKAGSLLRQSHDAGHTWGRPVFLPASWQTSEGSITRAGDGAMVVALRTAQAPGYLNYNDHWRRITTARSTDNGQTWTDHQVHFKYGKVHADLVTLPNGDILMTYAARMGELDGHLYHGIEAVLSHDNGKTWDWPNRYILFRWAMQQSMHSPQSVVLADGRIMTVFLYHYDAPWGKRILPEALNIGMVDAIFWTAE